MWELYIWSCSLLFLISLRSLEGSPLSVEGLSLQHTKEVIRRAKANEILKYMNENVDPCEDFYEFACGNYAAVNPATPQMPGTGFFATLQNELNQKIKSILTTEDLADTPMDKTVKSFFKSCRNLPAVQAAYPEKLQQIISEFGQMPALAGYAWAEEDFDWVRTVGAIAFKYDIEILLDFEIAIDYVNNTVNCLYISEPEFGVAKSLSQEGESFDQLAQSIILGNAARLEKFLNLPRDLALQTAAEIMGFERALVRASFHPQSVGQLSDVFTPMKSIDDVQQKYWIDMDFKGLLASSLGGLPNLKVYIDNVYTENLMAVLKNTPKRTVANYVFFKLIAHFLVDVPESAPKLDDVCIAHIKKNFYKNLDNMVYRKTDIKKTETGVNLMWKDIKKTFEHLLESSQLNWIAEGTRKYAKQKLQAMKYDLISHEKNNFDQILKPLYLNEQDYIENLKALLSSQAQQRHSISYDVPQNFDSGARLSTSPAYVTVENSVKVPVSLLHPFYAWSPSFPNAYNFGVLGSLLSHELIHGYDGGGRSYDAQGNNREWWDEDSANAFQSRSQCFIDQYKQYVFHGHYLPAMSNQNENIADNGGVRLAYRAYLKWYEQAEANQENMELESLQGVHGKFNHKQLFFISYGHLWCSDVLSNYGSTVVISDEHVPTKFRVIGPLANFDEFAREFNCPQGSAMNPVNKCEIY